jgi:hypothetical protein
MSSRRDRAEGPQADVPSADRLAKYQVRKDLRGAAPGVAPHPRLQSTAWPRRRRLPPGLAEGRSIAWKVTRPRLERSQRA